MPSLRELQCTFAAAIGGDVDAASRVARANGLPPEVRLDVYANNSWCAFRNTLQLEFPVVQRLGGDEWFRGAASEFRRAHPSRSGNLHHVGSAFAEFLRMHLAGTGYEVIADVAAFEWACQDVMIAPAAAAFDATALASLPPERYATIRFALAPDCRLVQSPFPVLDVWNANRDATTEPAPVDLNAGAQRVLVRRAGLELEFHRLDVARHAFLVALDAGLPLADAASSAIDSDESFPLGPFLQRCVATRILVAAASLN